MTKWWDAECRCPSACSVLKASSLYQLHPIPLQASCLGTNGDTGAARPCPAGRNMSMCDGHCDTEGDEIFVFLSCNSGCRKHGWVKLQKVNIAVLFLSKPELVEILCHVNPSCCAAEFSSAFFFFFFFFSNLVAGMPGVDLLFYQTAAWEKEQRWQMLTCRGSGLEGSHSWCCWTALRMGHAVGSLPRGGEWQPCLELAALTRACGGIWFGRVWLCK